MAAKRMRQRKYTEQSSFYTYGNVAHDLRPGYPPYPQRDEETKKREEQTRTTRAEARERRASSIRMIGAILVLFAGCILFMGMHVAVENLEVSIRKQKSELSDLKASNAILEAELTEQLDLDYIKQEAMERLGMAEPQAYQIIYIDVPKQSYTIQYEEEAAQEKPSLLARILELLKKD